MSMAVLPLTSFIVQASKVLVPALSAELECANKRATNTSDRNAVAK